MTPPTLTVGELWDTALRVREIGRADLREIDVAELVAHSTLLAEFVLIVLRDPEASNASDKG